MFRIDEDNNITITQGQTGYATITLDDSSDLVIGANDTIKVQVRVKPNGGRMLYEGTADPETLAWKIEPDDTMNIEPGRYYYDIRLTLAENGDVFYIVDVSDFVIEENVTRGGTTT